uniref:Zinc finger matrin-type protein 5 n=1 Tax=Crassostrea virginica TaxID=6565 RepID=A0A8B8DIA4_CRAVI|nr:zinc finger matrin-type protein 5-like isoform X1 [Crassostrea virginica]
MGRRYYCDFCDKSFADNPTHRKNHLKGVQHQRNRKAHYDSFRNPEIELQDELSKRPCKNFLSTGVCNFMENCKFSHLTTDRKADLEKLVKEKQKARERKSADQQDKDPEKKLSEWLSKRSKTDDQDLSTRSDEAPLLPVYEIPPHVTHIQNPPPSILPPPADVLRGLSFVDWG